MNKIAGEWLTVSAAARLKGVTREAVGKAIRTGRLPAQWAGSAYIVRRGDLAQWTPRGQQPWPIRTWRPSTARVRGVLCCECGGEVPLGAQFAMTQMTDEAEFKPLCLECLDQNPWPAPKEAK